MAAKKPPEVKVCEVIFSKSQQAECIEVMKQMLSSTDSKIIESKLKQISEMSGKDPDEILDVIYKYCPVCGEIGLHEHT